jgi:hypothetical protein
MVASNIVITLTEEQNSTVTYKKSKGAADNFNLSTSKWELKKGNFKT